MPRTRLDVLALLLLATMASGAPARASMLVTATQTGAGVVFSASGSLENLSGGAVSFPGIPPLVGASGFATGGSGEVDFYPSLPSFSGPFSIGPISETSYASVSSGDHVGVDYVNRLVSVPKGYTPGDALAASMTFGGETFASLGIAPGDYTWSWGEGDASDFVTLSITPEPGTGLLLAAGLVALSTTRRHPRGRPVRVPEH